VGERVEGRAVCEMNDDGTTNLNVCEGVVEPYDRDHFRFLSLPGEEEVSCGLRARGSGVVDLEAALLDETGVTLIRRRSPAAAGRRSAGS
jgi:hypothetical protein